MKKIYTRNYAALLFVLALLIWACDDFVKIDAPRTALVKSTVFESDVTADAAVLDIYYHLRTTGFANGSTSSVSFLLSLASDEQINYINKGTATSNAEYQQFNDNALRPNNTLVLNLWADLYKVIYQCNAVIEGLASSSKISEVKARQLEGEVKFIRAFCNFYLLNLFGDVPLVTTTDYIKNADLARASTDLVNQQIIDDLLAAQNQLPDSYSSYKNERVRASKWAATAMLARVYLFKQDWANAEIQSTLVISNSSLFSLRPTLSDVFKANSSEVILQWWSDIRPNDWITFTPLSDPPLSGGIRQQFFTSFEVGDQRSNTWVGKIGNYYGTRKYTASALTPAVEYSTVLRLAEQFLIRAEARAKQGLITGAGGAQADVNIIRKRAGLANTAVSTESTILTVIEKERRSELFNEWGHRWLDLKRTNRLTEVLSPLKVQWQTTAGLFPIPESEIRNNTSLSNSQNPGY